MQIFGALRDWWQHVYSIQLLIILIMIIALLRILIRDAEEMPERRFIVMSIAAGLLGFAAFGAAFRTPLIASVLDLQKGAIVEQTLYWIKALIALAAAGGSVYQAQLLAQKKKIRPCWAKGFAFALSVLAVGSYFRFGDFGYEDYYHRHEFFHYYLGSKYDRELGYERLYACAALAQADSGQANEVKARKLRNLATDVLMPAQQVLDNPEECRSRFKTPERWEAFKADVKVFRNTSSLQYWNDMQKDHGYNPPPVWTVMGHVLSSLHPATPAYMKLLAGIDIAFFAGMFAAIYWAFGWRVMSVAIIFWGCQLPAEYFWTGGAFMRQDWLFYLVLSGCLIRKRYFALGGASFAYSTLLRVFPGVLIAGWVVVALTHLWKHKRMAPDHVRVMMGGIAATAILVPLSIAMAGADSYPSFYKHIQVHNNTPLTNNMGLATVLAQGYEGRMEVVRDEKLLDPFSKWKEMRRERLKSFRPLHIVLLAGLAIAFVRVVSRVKSLWIAQALSLAIVVSVVEVTCYYYSMFILAAFLSRLRRGVEQWVLCVAGVSNLLVVNRYLSYFYDLRYTWQSVLFCVFAVSLLFAYWPKEKKKANEPSKLPAKPEADAVASEASGSAHPSDQPAS
ncbi:MAG TPA: hypothetical protein VK550_00865 [Polyangiaceae bacterium]|nr:hypothetical protein [Polyangiaceae bacterium]